MTEQESNKQIVRAYFDRCWNQGDLDFGRSIIADDLNFHLPLPPEFPRGYLGWRTGVALFLAAFPDCHWDVRQILADGDLVAVRTVWTGTQQAEFMGVPAQGRRVRVANSDYYRVRNGKFVEHWDVPDYLSLIRQLGASVDVVPSMFAASTEA